MDRVTDYESAGRKFESCWAHHIKIHIIKGLADPVEPFLFVITHIEAQGCKACLIQLYLIQSHAAYLSELKFDMIFLIFYSFKIA